MSRLLLTLLLLFTSYAEAGMNRFGLLAGANMASISSEPDDAFKSKMGIVAGGFYEYLVSSAIGLGSDFLLVGKGGVRGTDSVTFKINYFEIPLLLKVHLGIKRAGIYFFGGPHFGFVVSSNGELESGEELGITGIYPNEMGAQFGAGAELPISSSVGLLFNIRYSIGLSDISQAANNYKNNGIYILGGVSFRMDDEDQYTETEFRAQEYLRERNTPPPNSDGFVETPP